MTALTPGTKVRVATSTVSTNDIPTVHTFETKVWLITVHGNVVVWGEREGHLTVHPDQVEVIDSRSIAERYLDRDPS